MKIKELKVEFRYLVGNIACMSITSEKGKPINNDINNEDAIKMFNALIGSKENSIIQENKKYKEVIDEAIYYLTSTYVTDDPIKFKNDLQDILNKGDNNE